MPKLKRWNWSARTGSSRVMRELTAHGTTWMRAPGMAEKALANPWMTAIEILGTVPSRIEMYRIAAVKKTGSYVMTNSDAGFHVDPHRWGFPHVQIWFCIRKAARGGETCFIDTWPVLERVRVEDPALFRDLFRTPRIAKFVTGPVYAPMFAWQQRTVVCTFSLFVEGGHLLEERFSDQLAAHGTLQGVTLSEGEIIVNHNHRVLHGRSGYEGHDRELIRMTLWLADPLPVPDKFARPARAALRALGKQRARPVYGSAKAVHSSEAYRRLGIALAELTRIRNTEIPKAYRRLVLEPDQQANALTDAALDAALVAFDARKPTRHRR